MSSSGRKRAALFAVAHQNPSYAFGSSDDTHVPPRSWRVVAQRPGGGGPAGTRLAGAIQIGEACSAVPTRPRSARPPSPNGEGERRRIGPNSATAASRFQRLDRRQRHSAIQARNRAILRLGSLTSPPRAIALCTFFPGAVQFPDFRRSAPIAPSFRPSYAGSTARQWSRRRRKTAGSLGVTRLAGSWKMRSCRRVAVNRRAAASPRRGRAARSTGLRGRTAS